MDLSQTDLYTVTVSHSLYKNIFHPPRHGLKGFLCKKRSTEFFKIHFIM